jgi:hypothetical protein
MSLTSAIDALIAFVTDYNGLPVRQRPPFDVSRFEDLDRAVYVEACRLGLSNHMPRPRRGRTLETFGHTNLPGVRTMHDSPGYFELMPSQIRYWQIEMLSLRALAAGKGKIKEKREVGPRPPRGRKPDTDPKDDQRIADAWGSKQYKTYDELAKELGMDVRDVKHALDRVRWRRRSSRGDDRRSK